MILTSRLKNIALWLFQLRQIEGAEHEMFVENY